MVFELKLGEKLNQDGKPKDISSCQHIWFDVTLGENYRRKVRLVADGHKTDAPTSTTTYSSVVSHDTPAM
jgi:hypothetical protein